MKKLVFETITIIFASFFGIAVNAQNPSLELSWLSGSWNPGAGPTQGPSIVTQLQTFQNDALNNSNFSSNSPALTVTTALRNQVFTGYNYTGQQGTVTTGLSFGTSKSEYDDPLVTTQGPRRSNLFDLLGANVGPYGPTASLYRSSNGEALGTIDADFSQFGSDGNGGVSIFSTVEPLRLLPGVDKAGRYEYGELVIKFSRPVKDPVLQIASLGGSSWYSNNLPNWNIAYFSTELELLTPGFTSVRLSGTPYFDIQGNKILNSATRPNGDSQTGALDVKGFSTFGAASGSVQVIGTVDSLVYKVYLRGSSLSDYPFTFTRFDLEPDAARDPFYGDFWAISYSMKKPTQQITGSVYNDRDITDNNIYNSLGLPNGKTNVGGVLYANLLNVSAGLVVASVPVDANGNYLFDAVPVSALGYTVQLTTNPSAGTYAAPLAPPPTVLPTGWVNTGERIGIGTGNDGNTNGNSGIITVAANEIKSEINFGIRIAPCPAGTNTLFINPLAQTVYYGGFEAAAQNFNTIVAVAGTGTLPYHQVARTKLLPANYNIVYSPDLVAGSSFSSFTPAGGMNQMVVKTTSVSDTAWYVQDSVGFSSPPGTVKQGYFVKNSGGFLRGWFSKVNAGADPIIKIIAFDANNPAKVYGTITQAITGPAGTWRFINMPFGFTDSLCKKLRIAIISTVNNSSFAMDELCASSLAAASPVPIILSEFNVSKVNCTANLAWKTSTELNGDRFDIEVSTGNNGVYTTAGTVKAAGNSTTMQSYTFTYPMQPGVVYYFRIKMVDKDGSFKNSDIRSLSCTKGNTGIVIAPNPVITSFTIMGMENGKNTILVYTAKGQLVKTQTITQNQGDVNIAHLTPGMYTVKVTSETGNTVVSKLIKY